jgi:predicted RNA-binding Zn-ribbon protein involved in translation (DUF1610 family)
MTRYNNDPRWISAKYKCSCTTCKAEIKVNEQAFYFPLTKSVKCSKCGETASREFEAQAFDEDVYNS